ncbi:MAG TPA: MipA/OmpV family protein, partial [Plasticicumulans sp.]|nr:MipA/OmpV family protein [Plasticicumulans sp.]
RFLVAVSKRFPQFWVGGFARYDDLRGAVFEDSPLVDSRSSWAAGAAIAWVFDQSATRVPADDWRP